MRRRLTYANVAATLALVFAMSGGALAANRYLISSTKQISPKVLKKLKGNAGQAGTTGKTGATGAAGAPGAAGAAGKDGARGPSNLVATGFTTNSKSCALAEAEKYCFDSETEFTPSANAKCLVSVIASIGGLTSGTPTERGPYMRIAVNNGGTEENDKIFGYYFQGTAGTESIVQERTKLIAVQAGTTYNFGLFTGTPPTEWANKTAKYEVTYTCFAS